MSFEAVRACHRCSTITVNRWMDPLGILEWFIGSRWFYNSAALCKLFCHNFVVNLFVMVFQSMCHLASSIAFCAIEIWNVRCMLKPLVFGQTIWRFIFCGTFVALILLLNKIFEMNNIIFKLHYLFVSLVYLPFFFFHFNWSSKLTNNNGSVSQAHCQMLNNKYGVKYPIWAVWVLVSVQQTHVIKILNWRRI